MSRRGVVLFALLASACGGRITDPEAFFQPASRFACEVDVMETIIKPRCANAGCHESKAPAGGLALDSIAAWQGLVNQPAFGCNKAPLLSPTNPLEGHLFEKVEDARPRCGSPMPMTGARLTAAELDCLRRFVLTEVAPLEAP
ncbi:MAG: hypothetical protein IT381_24855 [Deltaproteobacteria bacterium]|nr:hypothetical protein [Deltaproteobacteria bacterium]